MNNHKRNLQIKSNNLIKINNLKQKKDKDTINTMMTEKIIKNITTIIIIMTEETTMIDLIKEINNIITIGIEIINKTNFGKKRE